MSNHQGFNQFQPKFGPTSLHNTSLSGSGKRITDVPSSTPPNTLHPGASRPPIAVKRRRTTSRTIWTFASILLALGTIVGATWFSTKAVADVTVYQVGVKNITRYVGGGGIVFPRQRLDLSYPFAERVVDVLVKAGDAVKPNQPLISLDPTLLNIQVQQAAANVAAAQAYLNSVTATGRAIDIAHAQQQYNIAKNKYNALVAQTSSPLLHNGNLISPMQGVVTAVNINPGEVFEADTVLLTIMDEAIAVIHAKIPLLHLGEVTRGQRAEVTPSALPDIHLQGTISAVIPHADPQTDTFEIWVDVDNARKLLLPGMSAFIRIQKQDQGLIAPRLAVLNPRHGAVAFVVEHQHAYLRQIEVVGRSEDTLIIGNGLNAGDYIVLVGQDTLYDGQEVRIREVRASHS
jgi:RND family efflux transporter MFP subunit